jgi:15-cis-phytoene synthase
MRTRHGEAIDPLLVEGYRQCARLTWRHGTTYFWGAALLPPERRRHVHAVYALCRLADDIVDLPEPGDRPRFAHGSAAGQRLEAFADGFRTALRERGSQDFGERLRAAEDPVLAAVVNTVITCGIEEECFDRFFSAMAMDLTTNQYETWEDLCGYMEGSAAVIGEMMLPILGPTNPAAKAPARTLGLAFQLTNFLRDVDEDLDRSRVFADSGITMLPARSARCVGAARVLYSRILDRIEAAGYDVFNGRIRVPTWRKAATAARIMVRPLPPGRGHRRGSRSHVTSDTL